MASVSKGFASILAGVVLSDGQDWSDPLSNYISDFEVTPKELTDSITIGHILSHSSGYPYQTYSTLIEDGIERRRLFEELKKIKLSRKPGDIHSYQNVAYSLIEPVIESVIDSSYQYVPIKLSPAYYNVAAAGGINASITDMAQWLKAILGQRPNVISTKVLDDVFTPRVRTSVKNYHFSNF